MNKTLPELCGIAAPGQKFMATKIVKHLQDGSVSNVVLPPASWGAVLLTCVNFLRNRWHGAPEDEGQMAYDTESLAEMLMSSGWRNRHASYSEFMSSAGTKANWKTRHPTIGTIAVGGM